MMNEIINYGTADSSISQEFGSATKADPMNFTAESACLADLSPNPFDFDLKSVKGKIPSGTIFPNNSVNIFKNRNSQ